MSKLLNQTGRRQSVLGSTLAALTAPIRWFAAHDIFVSYNRREAIKYAVALANRLAKAPHRFSSAVDHLESLPSPNTPERVLRHARWSRARVVLATPAALTSKEMARELEQIRRYPGPLIVIAQPGVTVATASWYADAAGVEPILESGGQAAFADGEPSEAVVESVLSVLTFTRRERRIAMGASAGAAFTLAGVLAALYFGSSAEAARDRADTAMQQATQAESAATAASMARDRAEVAASAATVRAEVAVAEAAVASRAQATAVEAAASASRHAQRETARAGVAQRLADASLLAAEATDMMELAPNLIAEAAMTARRSVELAPTPAGTAALRRAAGLMPPLRESINSECAEQNTIFDATRGWLVTGSQSGLCHVDLRRRVVTSRWQPKDQMVSLFAGPDGQVLYVGENVGSLSTPTVLLLDPAANWREVARLEINGQISIARFDPSGTRLAIGTEEGLFAIVTRQTDGHWVQGPFANGVGIHRAIHRLEFDASGRYLVVASQSALEIWSNLDELRPHRHRRELIGDKGLPFLTKSPPLAIDGAGSRLVVAFNDQIHIRSFPDLDPLQSIVLAGVDALQLTVNDRLITHTKSGSFQAWQRGRDGMYFSQGADDRLRGGLPTSGRLTTSDDGAYVWAFAVQEGDKAAWASLRRVSSGEEVARIGHNTYIRELLPWPQGRAWISVTADATIRIWNEPLDTAPTAHDSLEVQAAAIDGSAQRAAMYVSNVLGLPPRKIEAWDLEPQVRRRFETTVRGEVIALRVRGGREQVLDIFTDATWSQSRGWPPSEPTVHSPLPRRDGCRGRLVAWGATSPAPLISGARRELWLWRDETWQRIALPWLEANCVDALAVDQNLTLAGISSLGRGARVDVVNLVSGDRIFGVTTPYLVRSLAIDGAARRLLIGGSDPPRSRFTTGEAVVELRSLPGGRVLARARVAGGGIFSAACISPDGRRIAAEGAAIARVWEFDERTETLTPLAVHPVAGTARFCQFSEDGRRLAIGDKSGVRVIALDARDLLAEAAKRLGPLARP